MGAVNFSLDEKLVDALQVSLPIRTFVETGTFKGDTLARMVPYFDALYSAELSLPFWTDAADRFAHEPKVNVANANSADFITELQPSLAKTPTLFWLDAHWCGVENVAGDTSQCPLLAELRAIGSLPGFSVILIDDARLFLAPPAAPHEISQWPRFHEILIELLKLSDRHEIMIINDVIAFFPSSVRSLMEGYAQSAGIDWIAAAERLNDLLQTEAALREKEAMIQDMARSLVEKEQLIQRIDAACQEKEAMIQDMARRLRKSEQ